MDRVFAGVHETQTHARSCGAAPRAIEAHLFFFCERLKRPILKVEAPESEDLGAHAQLFGPIKVKPMLIIHPAARKKGKEVTFQPKKQTHVHTVASTPVPTPQL